MITTVMSLEKVLAGGWNELLAAGNGMMWKDGLKIIPMGPGLLDRPRAGQ